MSKRKLDEDTQYNYSNVTVNLSNLANLTSKYSMLCKLDDPLSPQINKINNSIPRVVVWGDQSCGKSSVLNKMFNLKDNYELKTGSNITTLCPLEIRCGPNYKESNIYVINELCQKTTFENLSAAQEFVQRESCGNEKKISHSMIIMETCYESNMVITDVPGCTIQLDDYNLYTANHYFDRPNTTILHIIRADIDPATEIASKYLYNFNKQIITVLTHTDKSDDKPYILQHVSNEKKIAIINNQDNEMNINNNICKKMNINKENIINGSNELRAYCVTILNNQMRDMFPKIKDLMTTTNASFKQHLENIGYTSPDPRNVCYDFRISMSNFLKERMLNNADLEKKLCALKVSVSQNELFKVKEKFVPSIEDIQEELKFSNRSSRTIKGTEGCEHTVRKYIKDIIYAIKKKMAEYVTEYLTIISNSIINILSNNSVRHAVYVTEYIKKIIIKTGHEKDKIMKSLIGELNTELDEIENLADTEDTNKSSYEDREYIKQIVDLTLKIYNSSKHSPTHDSIINTILSQQQNIDINYYSAKRIDRLIHVYWESKSKQICDRISEKVAKYEKELEKNIDKEISVIESNDVIEPADLNDSRLLLTQITNVCDQIINEKPIYEI